MIIDITFVDVKEIWYNVFSEIESELHLQYCSESWGLSKGQLGTYKMNVLMTKKTSILIYQNKFTLLNFQE